MERLSFLPKLYLVGGAVRDLLAGLEPEDLDFATAAPPEEVMRLAAAHGIRAVPTGLEHGTVTLLIDHHPYEVTTFRRDVETYGRRARVVWGQSIEEDLARRDFTIGAIAMDAEGRVVDPFGGQQDLKRGLIRAVGDPKERFREDYLRVIRAGRLAARYGFSIEENTLQAAREVAPQVLEHVAVERVTAELEKAFRDPRPSPFLRYLYELGLLGRLIPELEGTHLLLQDPRWHPEGDVLTHVLEVVDRAPPRYRWHALLHDIGKKDTAVRRPEGYYSFPGHAEVGARLIPRIAQDLRLPSHLREEIATTTALHMVPALTPPTPAAIRRFQARAGPHLEAVRAVFEADGAGRRPPEAWRFFEPQPTPIEPLLKGRHLIARGHTPGPAFGPMLQAAYQHQLETGETDLEKLYQVALAAGSKPR
ncbi:CCA tRNA nucleotidyltransferase [Meiothermus sp. QL-1]|uniref:CCA tRNA nucleotidyltransferase n=1 Tax=Meiothermus sp. QL-1 TaxID=2058095 RepID=UPI001F28B3BB|nr:CCA tRNA nucleotidyltransferase [Meiothermus sp. QL-1]